MWKLAPPGSPIDFYGYIVRAKTSVVENKRIGYKIAIRTTIQVESGNQWLPVYVSYTDRSPNRRLYEWWVQQWHRKDAPIHIIGRKRGQCIYRNTKYQEIEPSQMIIWVFIHQRGKMEFVKEIPPEKLNIRIDSSVTPKAPRAVPTGLPPPPRSVGNKERKN